MFWDENSYLGIHFIQMNTNGNKKKHYGFLDLKTTLHAILRIVVSLTLTTYTVRIMHQLLQQVQLGIGRKHMKNFIKSNFHNSIYK